MISTVEAISVSEEVLPGGTTRPMVIIVKDDQNDFRTCVVKTFSENDYKQYSPVANECLGGFFAKQFDLPTPNSFLVKFTNDFIDNQLTEEVKKRIDTFSDKYFFGSEYQNGFIQYVPLKHARSFLPHDIETVFALDVLIRNKDRRKGKPNLLVKGKNYFLIDHELCFDIEHPLSFYVTKDLWPFISGRGTGTPHIFLEPLKRINKRSLVTFDTFFEYLRVLNINDLADFHKKLARKGVYCKDFSHFVNYLKSIKANPSEFKDLLYHLLQ